MLPLWLLLVVETASAFFLRDGRRSWRKTERNSWEEVRRKKKRKTRRRKRKRKKRIKTRKRLVLNKRCWLLVLLKLGLSARNNNSVITYNDVLLQKKRKEKKKSSRVRKAFHLSHFLLCFLRSALQIIQDTERGFFFFRYTFLPVCFNCSWYLMSSAFVCGQAFFIFFLLLIEFWFLQQLFTRVWRWGTTRYTVPRS